MGIAQRVLAMELLRKNRLRRTPQRLELLKVLESKRGYHPSFSEIYEEVKKNLQSVSQSTILKNLSTFEELGTVRSFSFKGETRYELNPTPHVNLAKSNGEIVDVEGEGITKALDNLVKAIEEGTGIDAENLLIIVE